MDYYHKYLKYKRKYLELKKKQYGGKEAMMLLKTFSLTSSAFENNKPIPKKYTTDGENISPQLKWKVADVPKDTKYYALVVDDPNAPEGKFIHWIMWNIPGDTTEIKENFKPGAGIEVGANNFKKSRYMYRGPAPPKGDPPHNYHFLLYALNSKLDIPKDAYENISAVYTGFMRGKILGVGKLIGTYKR